LWAFNSDVYYLKDRPSTKIVSLELHKVLPKPAQPS